ncbi:MAG: class I SAM-dependent methyltransferase [Bacteroidales bacterium]
MFDNVAQLYDESFTSSGIGKALRRQVYVYLETILPENKPLDILELNCGTGHDALYFAKRGHNVIATDISSDMIAVANDKAKREKPIASVRFVVSDMRDLSEISNGEKFDLIFSNFGGLNCLDSKDLKILSYKLSLLLKKGGRFIAVVMPKICLWESAYFIVKFKMKNVLRRNTNDSVMVNVGNSKVETWYYSPGDFKRIFVNEFQVVNRKPVGIMLPPSYMEPYYQKKPYALKRLEYAERLIGNIPALSYLADHFLIDFRKR